MRASHSLVVPAKAGTHTPCSLIFGAVAETFSLIERRWLWVPAFAGTTKEDSIVKQPHRHCEPTGRRKAPPDDRLREAIYGRGKKKAGLLRRSAPRNDDKSRRECARATRSSSLRKQGPI